MRYLCLVLTVFFPAVLARAQNILEGTAPLPISTFEAASNTAMRVDTSSATNTEKSGRSSFLMDAGVQYADEGEYEEAERAYLRALANDPGDPDIRFRLSTLYIMMKRYKEAADILNGLTLEFPGNPMTHNNLAWIYATGGEMKNGALALRHAREALLSGPTQPALWNTLAEAYYVLGLYDEALRASECAFDLLKIQNASEKQIAEFGEQRTKILRAGQAHKRLLGTDDEK